MLKIILKNAFDFRGQSSRLGYLLYGCLFPLVILALIILMMMPYIELQGGIKLNEAELKQALLGLVALVPFALAMSWVSLVQMIKRMRDLGHSGWWILLVFMLGPLPYIGAVIALCFFGCLYFYPGYSREKPTLTEWQLVGGVCLLIVAVITFEGFRIQANKKAQTTSESATVSQPEESTQPRKDASESATTESAMQKKKNDISMPLQHLPQANTREELVGRQSNWNKKSYRELKNKFLDMGLCNACADNIALYVRAPKESQCAILAIKALNGDQLAILALNEQSSEICTLRITK